MNIITLFKAENSFKWGMAITIPHFGFLAWIAWLKWEELPYLAANEIGDALAGAFGPVAFLWLILGYIQQQSELRLNTDSLQLQVKELRESVKQQEVLAEANQKMIHLELKKSFANSQPIFNLIEKNTPLLQSDDQLVLKFRNHGHPITYLRVTFGEPTSPLEFDHKGFIDRNETFEIKILHRKISHLTKLNFEYLDGLHDPQNIKYSFMVFSKKTDKYLKFKLIEIKNN